MLRKLLLIKWENILLMLLTPVAIIQFTRAGAGFKLMSIAISLLMYGGLALLVRYGRKEKLKTIPAKTEIDYIIYDIRCYLVAFNNRVIKSLTNLNNQITKANIIEIREV